ncbi:MAG: 30S ribosomal protein S11 [Oligoflexia bacterium]|nr:30S ribosomal protein S11 [Oligoflexia bacterium]
MSEEQIKNQEEGTAEAATATAEVAVKRKKGKRSVSNGIVYIAATFNNTIISVADATGNVISWSSAGAKGFRGSRKNTPFAAQVAAEDAVRKALECGLRTVSVEVKGPGAGRESALRAVQAAGIRVTQIKDTTPIPHNGCRPPKRRRV